MSSQVVMTAYSIPYYAVYKPRLLLQNQSDFFLVRLLFSRKKIVVLVIVKPKQKTLPFSLHCSKQCVSKLIPHFDIIEKKTPLYCSYQQCASKFIPFRCDQSGCAAYNRVRLQLRFSFIKKSKLLFFFPNKNSVASHNYLVTPSSLGQDGSTLFILQ